MQKQLLGLLVKLYDSRIGAIQFSNRLVDRSELSKSPPDSVQPGLDLWLRTFRMSNTLLWGSHSWGTKPNDVFRGVVVSAVETTHMMMSRNFRNEQRLVIKSPTICVVLHHSNVSSPLETLSQI
jgi:hypothetical protein